MANDIVEVVTNPAPPERGLGPDSIGEALRMLRHRARLHVSMAVLFSILWAGTFVTGLFFLPHN